MFLVAPKIYPILSRIGCTQSRAAVLTARVLGICDLLNSDGFANIALFICRLVFDFRQVGHGDERIPRDAVLRSVAKRNAKELTCHIAA